MATSIPIQVSDFLNYKLIERGISENTLLSYRTILREFCAFLDHEKEPAQAEASDLKRYLSACYARPLSPQSVQHHISVLREFFKYLQLDRVVQRDPMVRIESPKGWKRMPRYMPEIDVHQLIDAPGPDRLRQALSLRDRAICETLYASAIRVSELISAKLPDLNLGSGILTVFGKGSKERRVPLGRLAVDALRAYLNAGRPPLHEGRKISPYLFISYRTPRLTRQAVNNMLRKRAKRAGIPHVYPHMLRHSAATHMMNHGAGLRVIQEILGHADISTTEIYTHVSGEHVSSVFRSCHPRNNPTRAQMALFQTPAPILAPGPTTCVECNELVSEGKTRCERHLQLARAACKRSRQRRARRAQPPTSTLPPPPTSTFQPSARHKGFA